MKTTEDRIEQIKAEGYEIDFSTVFNDAFETWKRSALMSGLACLIFGIVISGLAIGVMAVVGGVAAYTSFALDMSTGELSIGFTILYCVGTSVIAGLTNAFPAGLIKMAHQAETREELSVGDAFQCYRQPYFIPLFIEAFVISMITISATTFLQQAFPFSISVRLLTALFSLLLTFMTMMAVPLIIFGNLKPLDAIRSSFIVVGKNFWLMLGLILVAALLAGVGILGLCIGLLFTIPFIHNMYYALYKHSVGLPDNSEIEEIGASEF